MAIDQAQQAQNVTVMAYILKRKKQIRVFIILSAMTVLLFLGFGAGLIYKHITTTRQYEQYIGVADSTEYSAKVSAYVSGIKLIPKDPRAYIKLLEAYEQNGVFDIEQSGEFTALYNQYSKEIKPEETGDLNYKAGRMYFNLYTENGEPVSMSARVQKSASFFDACTKNPPSDKSAADVAVCYSTICNYYKNYILKSSDTKEITAETISSLLSAANKAIEAVQNNGEYDQLLLYSSVCNFLYDQRIEIATVYRDKLDEIIALLDKVETLTKDLAVVKPESITIQNKILGNIDDYRTAIMVAFES